MAERSGNKDLYPASCPYLSNTFLKILDDYAALRLQKDRTKRQYEYVIYALCNYSQCDFLDLTKEQLEAYFRTIGGDIIRSTNYDMTVLRALSRFLDEKADFYHISPRYLSLFSDINIEFPDLEFDPEDLPELADVDRILQYFNGKGDYVGFLAVSIVLRTVMTTSEMALLHRDMFFQDSNGNYGVRFKASKHAYRFVKIPDDIAELIIKYTNQRTDDNPALLLNKKGKPISSRALQNRLREACLSCNIDPFTYNDLRILGQAIMIEAGAPIDKIAEQANLKKTVWFFRYNRVIKELTDSAVDYVHIKITW